jgi:hypothetical protein
VVTETVNPRTTTTTVTMSANPVALYTPYTVYATVTNNGAPAATGTVTFWSQGQLIQTVTLSGGTTPTASVVSIPTYRGTVNWQVVYNGDANNPSSTSTVVVESVY